MPTFRLVADVTVSAYTTVDAATVEDAIEIAKDREAAIGGINSGQWHDEVWIIDDADGTPQGVRLAD